MPPPPLRPLPADAVGGGAARHYAGTERESGRARREARERGHRTQTRTHTHTHMISLLPPIYQAWVVLPHCMQTSAGFWARVGFELGAEVDRKEAKMAMLRSVGSLKGDVNTWSHSLTGHDGSPAAQLEGEGPLCKCA